nr:VOC family protein [Auraticoccus cholistanensis]
MPAERHAAAAAFWAAVTEMPPSSADAGGVVLLPADGSPYLQLRPGEAGLRLELAVPDPDGAVAAALRAGASTDPGSGPRQLRSPGGLRFGYVEEQPRRRPPVRRWPDGRRAMVDQVCVDAAPGHHEAEVAFWATLTGLPPRPSGPEFVRLTPPPEQPLQLILQRLQDGSGPTTAHLDLGTSAGSRDTEVDRHRELGAELVRRFEDWTVLRDPAGTTYCVTDHLPR